MGLSKGKAPMRRVSVVDDEGSPRIRPATPGPSNHRTAQESPETSHVSSARGSRSRANSEAAQPTTSAPAPSTAAPAPAPVTAPQAVANGCMPTYRPQQPFYNWGYPYQPQAVPAQPWVPTPAPPTDNPPDELGPPPPPPPPPAIPPVVNPHGVHFQPQVPSTELGPMVHRYTPRMDAPNILPRVPYLGGFPGHMANPAAYMMNPSTAVTAPFGSVVLQQPIPQTIMAPNQSVPGGPPLMLSGPNTMPMMFQQGINPLAPGMPTLPGQAPIHTDPAMGVGLTPNETLAETIRMAQDNKAYEPQDFKPADPDPYRLYLFRELDGTWATFQRRQIDRLNARWYTTHDGIFYACRLSE